MKTPPEGGAVVDLSAGCCYSPRAVRAQWWALTRHTRARPTCQRASSRLPVSRALRAFATCHLTSSRYSTTSLRALLNEVGHDTTFRAHLLAFRRQKRTAMRQRVMPSISPTSRASLALCSASTTRDRKSRTIRSRTWMCPGAVMTRPPAGVLWCQRRVAWAQREVPARFR